MSNPKKWPPVVVVELQSAIGNLISTLETAHGAGQLANAEMRAKRNVDVTDLPAAKMQHVFIFTLVDGRVFQVAVSELAETPARSA